MYGGCALVNQYASSASLLRFAVEGGRRSSSVGQMSFVNRQSVFYGCSLKYLSRWGWIHICVVIVAHDSVQLVRKSCMNTNHKPLDIGVRVPF